jgi:hypothetical protein
MQPTETQQYACPTCRSTKRECDDSAAHGDDNCCMSCDEVGRHVNHAAVNVGNVDGYLRGDFRARPGVTNDHLNDGFPRP